MEPKEILEKRTELYKRGDAAGIFELYAEESEFRYFFPRQELYIRHFTHASSERVPGSLEIFRETVGENEGEILYLETFDCMGERKKYYSKTRFVKEEGRWKIKSEVREEHKPEE